MNKKKKLKNILAPALELLKPALYLNLIRFSIYEHEKLMRQYDDISFSSCKNTSYTISNYTQYVKLSEGYKVIQTSETGRKSAQS